MERRSVAATMLAQEAGALLSRTQRMRPYALHESMLPAASISAAAQSAIEHCLANGRRIARSSVREFIDWLDGPAALAASPAEAQARFTVARLRFNAVLSEFDLLADALTQRSEDETGVWLAGLDVLAAEALALEHDGFVPPPVICYLDRGPGAAIRRARTRLPAGSDNPIAIVRVPRERMIGSAIASSLIHEVGHQGAALLELNESLRTELRLRRPHDARGEPWRLFERWISEIVADFWSVARLGITSSVGLISVLSLPRPFVFRMSRDDPHPFPWIRLKISCAIGDALHPHAQWRELADLWEQLYPTAGLHISQQRSIDAIERMLPSFVAVLCNHTSRRLRGRTLADVLESRQRRPDELRRTFEHWRTSPALMRNAAPSLVFAALGQARIEGRISPASESRVLASMLRYWAVERTFSQAHVEQPRSSEVIVPHVHDIRLHTEIVKR